VKNIKYILLQNVVTEIKKEGSKFKLTTNENSISKTIYIDKLVITTPAFKAKELLKDLYPAFASAAEKIFYSPMCLIHSVYLKGQVSHTLNGFGALNPAIEKRFSTGCIWNSSTFKDRCPSGQILLTSFVGGSRNIEQFKKSDEEILNNVHKELSESFNITGKPVFQKVFKWEKSIPQYTQSLKMVKNHIGQMENEHIYFSTNWIGGVSLSDCIKKSKALADKF
jgi:protoporphyrinogen/coproporphyrinogen III oxidase